MEVANFSPPVGTKLVSGRSVGRNMEPHQRSVVEEVPIEIVFNGQSYAVMMVTPCDLEDFVRGFTLSERLVANDKDIASITLTESTEGWVAECHLDGKNSPITMGRSRQRQGDSSCGLCGVGRLSQVHQSLPRVKAKISVNESALFEGLAALPEWQPLNRMSGGVHAAAWVDVSGRIQLAREDVGRHNAFDKLIGAMSARSLPMNNGFVLLSSRCSYELVEKAIIAGVPLLVTISAPTSLAVSRAAEHDLALVALARSDSMFAVHGPEVISQ